jgi:hypothetical protein
MKGLKFTLLEINLGCKPRKTHLSFAEDIKGRPRGIGEKNLEDSLREKKDESDRPYRWVFQSK